MVEFDRRAHRRPRTSPATGGARAAEIVAEPGLSGARPPDRGDGAAAADHAGRRRRVAPAQRRRDLCRRAAPGDDHQLHARRSPPDRASRRSPRSAPSSTRSSSGQGYTQGTRRRAAGRAQQGTRRSSMPNTDAGRAELLAEPQRRREGHVRRGCRGPSRPCPSAAARNPPRAAGDPGRRVQRLLPPRLARWLAPGDLLHQPQGHRRLAEIFAADADLSRGRPRPSPADQHRPGHRSDMPMLRKIGFFSAYGEGWALYAEQLADELGGYNGDRARRLSSSPSCSAPRGWWSTPASTPSAGAASRRSTTWSRRPASPAPRVAARDRALLRLDRPGLQLQGRPHRLDSARAPKAQKALGRQVRPQASSTRC